MKQRFERGDRRSRAGSSGSCRRAVDGMGVPYCGDGDADASRW
jgi:hypothetical protein